MSNIKLYSHDNRELELKEDIDEGIDFNLERDKDLLEQENVIVDDEIDNNYIEESSDEDLMEDDEELFGDLDDDEDEEIFNNDLAIDNLDNDQDDIEE